MDDSVRLRLAGFPRERTWLLPALLAVQETEGWLSSEALTAVAEHVRVSPSEACAIATDYSTFRRVKPGSHLVRVCAGLSCRLAGAADHLRASRTAWVSRVDTPRLTHGSRSRKPSASRCVRWPQSSKSTVPLMAG